MITDGEKWHYTALKSESTKDGFNRPIKSLSRLFRGITSNDDGDFYCLNCLHSFRTGNALKVHERLCENNDYCKVEMPTKLNETLKYNYSLKSLRTQFVIYADLECLLLKQSKQNKQIFYRGRDCIKKFCSDIKELRARIVNYEQKEMIPLTDNENKYYEE